MSEEVDHRDAQSQGLVAKLGGACLTFATELTLAREREQGYIETINSQKKKGKRGRPLLRTSERRKALVSCSLVLL